MSRSNSVAILQQRANFLQGIAEAARLCNWPSNKTEELVDHVGQELIRIDNFLMDQYEATDDFPQAYRKWSAEMESLRHWLSLILGIKIKYV